MNRHRQLDTLFLDRDGVINVQLVGDYVKRVEELELREDFLMAIPLLRAAFRRFIVVTNQQCIAKGLCTRADVDTVHAHLREQLSAHGLTLDAIYVCPHLAGAGCHCRKPEPGMMEQALTDFPDIDRARSLMVGDSASDMRFGRNAGLPTLFIGKVTDDNRAEIAACADIVFPSLLQFAQTL